jgi:hypothetical protein
MCRLLMGSYPKVPLKAVKVSCGAARPLHRTRA